MTPHRPCRRATVGCGYSMCNLPGYDHIRCQPEACGFYDPAGCGWFVFLVIALAGLGIWSVLVWIGRIL